MHGLYTPVPDGFTCPHIKKGKAVAFPVGVDVHMPATYKSGLIADPVYIVMSSWPDVPLSVITVPPCICNVLPCES